MKKCPNGVICIENITMFLGVFTLFVVSYLIYSHQKQHIYVTTNEDINIQQPLNSTYVHSQPNYPYTNVPVSGNVLLNPYSPPLKDDRYFVNGYVPINVPTNISAVESSFRQLGILTPLNGKTENNILPLMGKPLITRRSLWNYYTISNQHNNVKLPILVKNKSGLNENGVDEIYSGDTVYVEGYNDAFKVTIYENSTIRYLPL